ncbi:unnamed protein product [Victoria cruziana]
MPPTQIYQFFLRHQSNATCFRCKITSQRIDL